jgi:hypothetical protein
MKRQTIHTLVKTCLLVLALAVGSTVPVGAPPGKTPEVKKDKSEPDASTKAGEENRREAERVVRGIEVEILSDDQWIKVPRIEAPLLFYSDPTRNNDRGSVWGWGPKGRPVALLELYQNTEVRTRWALAICNTSGGKLRARREGAPWWLENDSATELKDVPGAAAPAAEAAVRQRQLKLLAQKFTGHQFWDPDNTRYDLRLLKRPLHTYKDEAGGILEGGLFTLANGTNPEIVLFIEAREDPKNKEKSVWQYAVGRLAHAELHLEYDGKEVFEAPRGNRVAGRDKPYFLDLIAALLPTDPEKP